MEVGGDHLPMRGSGGLRMGKGACHLGKEDPRLLSSGAHLWSPWGAFLASGGQ